MTPDKFKDIILSGKSFKKDPITVDGCLSLVGCSSLKVLPKNLTVKGYLNLSGCASLRALPDNLTINGGLGIHGCISLLFNGSFGNIKGSIYMDIGQMMRVPYEYLPLYVGYTYANEEVFECLKQRLLNPKEMLHAQVDRKRRDK